jgi:hypothetical protein
MTFLFTQLREEKKNFEGGNGGGLRGDSWKLVGTFFLFLLFFFYISKWSREGRTEGGGNGRKLWSGGSALGSLYNKSVEPPTLRLPSTSADHKSAFKL